VPEDDTLRAELSEVTELLRLNPGDPELRFRRGLARARMGDLAGAIEDFSHVISDDPGHHIAMVNRGEAYLEGQDYLRAVADFDNALSLDPDDAMTLNDRGVARQRLERFDAALEDFTQASRINPDLLGPRINAAWMLIDQGRYADAIDVCTNAEGMTNPQDLLQLRALVFQAEAKAAGASFQAEAETAAVSPDKPAAPATPGPSPGEVYYYSLPDSIAPELTDELRKALEVTAAPFTERGDLAAPPVGRLREVMRCIHMDDLDEGLQALFQFAFPRFFEHATTPADVAGEAKLRGSQVEKPFNYRRFSGDVSLPRGRYFSLSRPGTAAGDGTLAQELLAYAEMSRTGALDAVDLSDPDAAALRRSYQPLFGDGPVPESAIVLRFFSRPGCPSQALDVLRRASGDFSSPIAEAVGEFPIFIPTRTVEVDAAGVMDLRTAAARAWILDALTKGLPTLAYEYRTAGRSPRLFLGGRAPESFAELLPLLLFQARGGSPVLDGIAAHLRSMGVQGLVYPSARCDPMVRLSTGRVEAWSGWCFVDYRDAPRQRPALRMIADPDSWAQTTAPLAIHVAPQDHPIAGSFAVEGNVSAISAVRRYESELYYQRFYFADTPEASVPGFRLPDIDSQVSVVQIRALLAIGRINLASVAAGTDGSEIAVGDVIAAALPAPPEPGLQPRFRADHTWFVYRIGTWDAVLQTHCAVCDYEELWPVDKGELSPHCPRCGFVGEGLESMTAMRARLLRLFDS
jgi:tetratricopeptide (TPR) repeat protein